MGGHCDCSALSPKYLATPLSTGAVGCVISGGEGLYSLEDSVAAMFEYAKVSQITKGQ